MKLHIILGFTMILIRKMEETIFKTVEGVLMLVVIALWLMVSNVNFGQIVAETIFRNITMKYFQVISGGA